MDKPGLLGEVVQIQLGTDEERVEVMTRRLLGWRVPVRRGGLGCWTDDCSEWDTGRCRNKPTSMARVEVVAICPLGLTIEGLLNE